jgi:transcriptional regulator with XRE-family HTH domain
MMGIMKVQWDATRIKAIREFHGMSQEEFAAALGTKKQHISQWETGASKPNQDTLCRICERFNAHPSAFFLVKNGSKP